LVALIAFTIAAPHQIKIEGLGRTVTINGGVEMTTMNLGTCCGSKPSVGLPAWLKAGGTGIDTAFDYSDQADIAKIIHAADAPSRQHLFITTKVNLTT